MDLYMMEIEKMIKWKEKELNLKFYNNFRKDSLTFNIIIFIF